MKNVIDIFEPVGKGGRYSIDGNFIGFLEPYENKMKMEKFCVTIADLPDRENLVAEVDYEGVQWVEISKEKEELMIQFYSHPREKYWEFPLDEALEALEKAKKRFLEMQIIRE